MIEGLLSDEEIDDLIDCVRRDIPAKGRRGGVRNLLDFSKIRDLADSPAIRAEVETILGSRASVVRGILFDKTEGSNWKVPWHQDVTIAVDRRVEVPGYGPWSIKEGILHVQPPAEVLENMLSIRLHLDDCPEENGALRVIPGSHTGGKLGERQIQELGERSIAVTCAMRHGGVLMMRPLLLHASSASSFPGHRRVVHLDYAAVDLPLGMGWATAQS